MLQIKYRKSTTRNATNIWNKSKKGKKKKKIFVSIRRNYSTIIVHPHHFGDYFIPIFKNIKHFWESVPLFFMATKSTVWVTNQWDQETKSSALRVHGMVSNKASKNQFFSQKINAELHINNSHLRHPYRPIRVNAKHDFSQACAYNERIPRGKSFQLSTIPAFPSLVQYHSLQKGEKRTDFSTTERILSFHARKQTEIHRARNQNSHSTQTRTPHMYRPYPVSAYVPIRVQYRYVNQ